MPPTANFRMSFLAPDYLAVLKQTQKTQVSSAPDFIKNLLRHLDGVLAKLTGLAQADNDGKQKIFDSLCNEVITLINHIPCLPSVQNAAFPMSILGVVRMVEHVVSSGLDTLIQIVTNDDLGWIHRLEFQCARLKAHI